MSKKIKGVLFDMDGVLVDSEKYICDAAILMFGEKGLTVKAEDFIPFIGKGENRYIGGVAEHYNFPIVIEKVKARTYAIYEEITKGKLEALPGVHTFMRYCREHGLKMSVATSADRVKMLINLKGIGLSESCFDATVNGLEVERKKPFPDIFIFAAQKLGLKPEECLVVEDAISGVEAAKAAGAKCLGLTTSFKATDLAKADWISKTLADAPKEATEW